MTGLRLEDLVAEIGVVKAARSLGMSRWSVRRRLKGLNVTQPHGFTVEPLPFDALPSAEELITQAKARFEKKKARHDASKLRQVHIHMPGPIGIGYFGDPHIDDDGCDWIRLEQDIKICQDTPGLFASNVGDTRNNWVGRLMALYADLHTTASETLVLIKWLFEALPWLLTIGGNHDKWGHEHGDAAQIIHQLTNGAGLYEDDGARMQINLPGGASFIMHMRHDFPGSSQFNPGHAFVRETLFNYRDHVMVAGHRHQSGYIPIWHNDPARLCHGIRVAGYKHIDHYASEKHFKEENWAPAMGIVVDPTKANSPVDFIRVCFSIEETADYLNYRRAKWAN